MLNLYYGTGRVDKEKFIFSKIKGKTFLVVPDQFSLQAERDAFFYLKTKGLMDLQIVDFAGLGNKVMNQVGGVHPPLIDKYGRHMLIAKIIDEKNTGKELAVYSGLSWKNTFIDMMSRLISEMKRYDNRPEDIEHVAKSMAQDGFLKRKLKDIGGIYASYSKAIEGKYMDSEDYIIFYGSKIMNAPMIQEADVWIYGFDSFDPINKSIIERLLKTACSVNIVMTRCKDIEELDFTEWVIRDLEELTTGCGEEFLLHEIEEAGELTKPNVWDRQKNGEDSVTLAELSTPYSEAERAAAYILHLVRDKALRYADIAVICNDMEGRGNALRRILLRWNIPVFMDRRRKVLHHSAVSFLIALMEIISGGYSNGPIMRILKSGIIDKPFQLIEAMENYVKQYKIRGTMWKEPFVRGRDYYGEDGLRELESLRGLLVETIETAREKLGARNTVESKIRGIYDFLVGNFNMEERIGEIIKEQEDDGFRENAAETAQSWNVICNILNQLVETLGDENISNKHLTLLMKAGFESVEIGLVPTTSDSILIGSLSRAMVSRKKAIVIIGANQGILPRESIAEGLISEYEKEQLENHDLRLSKSQNAMICEDRLALYRSLYVAEEHLYISCSRTSDSGETLAPNQLFQVLRQTLKIDPLDDIEKETQVLNRLTTKEGSLGYLAGAFREYGDTGKINPDWLSLRSWYETNEPGMLDRMEKGMGFNNVMEELGKDFADALYKGDRENLEVSASRLEKHSACPFAHFMDYGLRPEEQRTFEIGAREIGDVYHRCLMMLSRRLTEGGVGTASSDSRWGTITREECRNEIWSILTNSFEDYKEGVLFNGPAEDFRRQRLLDICDRTAWQMIQQVRKGKIKEMFFEEPFGSGCRIPPVEIDLGGESPEGEKKAAELSGRVLIRGVIDRMDVLENDALRIIDYKTGGNKIKQEYFEEGYRLQLMVYMKAAAGGDAPDGSADNTQLNPAGVFYFKIKDLDTDAANSSAMTVTNPMEEESAQVREDLQKDLDKRLENAYQLEGIVVNDDKIIAAMDKEFDGKSSVLPIKRDKSGDIKAAGGGTLLLPDEFSSLQDCVDKQVQRICREISQGKIDVSPTREKEKTLYGQMTACQYCDYKSVCLFDTSFAGCRYREV